MCLKYFLLFMCVTNPKLIFTCNLQTCNDHREDTLITPSWMWEIIYRAPMLYYEYYFTNHSALLPPRRQSCLLRSAIENAQVELASLRDRIAAKDVHFCVLLDIVLLVWNVYDLKICCARRFFYFAARNLY